MRYSIHRKVRTDGRKDGRTDGQTDRRTDGQPENIMGFPFRVRPITKTKGAHLYRLWNIPLKLHDCGLYWPTFGDMRDTNFTLANAYFHRAKTVDSVRRRTHRSTHGQNINKKEKENPGAHLHMLVNIRVKFHFMTVDEILLQICPTQAFRMYGRKQGRTTRANLNASPPPHTHTHILGWGHKNAWENEKKRIFSI